MVNIVNNVEIVVSNKNHKLINNIVYIYVNNNICILHCTLASFKSVKFSNITYIIKYLKSYSTLFLQNSMICADYTSIFLFNYSILVRYKNILTYTYQMIL